MRHWFVTLATVVSGLVCGAMIVLWVWSQWVETYACAGAPGPGSGVVVVERGEVLVITCGEWPHGSAWNVKSERISSRTSYTPGIAPDARGSLSGNWGFDLPGLEVQSQRGWLILPHAAGTVSTSMPTAQVTLTRIALGWLVVVLGVLPALRAGGRARRRWTRRSGCCPKCSYDLL